MLSVMSSIPHEGRVALPDLGLEAGAVGRRLLHHEAALGAHGHDHRVLHHLGLHEAEHLGAEVLHAVRPAQAAAATAAAQVHRRDEYTQISNIGLGSGRSGTLAGSSLKLSQGR